MENYVGFEANIPEKGLTYHIVTYGCQMNDHESEKIAGMVQALGYVPAVGIDSAKLIVFNTCCIRDNAELKVFGNVGALKGRKQKEKDLIIAVCGCMTQQENVAKKLARMFPFVDIVLGTHNISELPDRILDKLERGKKTLHIAGESTLAPEGLPIVRNEKPLASVNIMYGCDNYCSYCIVPYVRGKEKSRLPENIISEVNTLHSEGYKEVMLLGQNVNSYSGPICFPELLGRLCDETDIERIRFMTSHPKDLSDALIEVMHSRPQICKHIHLPVQSGSTRVLSLMNRKYTREGYLQLVNKLRAAMPDIVITTDFIVGFPGETEEDFAQTLALAGEVRFDAAFTFVYSKRSGTKAAEMEGHLPAEISRRRILALINLQNRITEEKNAALIGNVYRVLAQDVSARDSRHICGRTDGNKMVNFAGTADMIGDFYDVRITQGKKTTLFGEIV